MAGVISLGEEGGEMCVMHFVGGCLLGGYRLCGKLLASEFGKGG